MVDPVQGVRPLQPHVGGLPAWRGAVCRRSWPRSIHTARRRRRWFGPIRLQPGKKALVGTGGLPVDLLPGCGSGVGHGVGALSSGFRPGGANRRISNFSTVFARSTSTGARRAQEGARRLARSSPRTATSSARAVVRRAVLLTQAPQGIPDRTGPVWISRAQHRSRVGGAVRCRQRVRAAHHPGQELADHAETVVFIDDSKQQRCWDKEFRRRPADEKRNLDTGDLLNRPPLLSRPYWRAACSARSGRPIDSSDQILPPFLDATLFAVQIPISSTSGDVGHGPLLNDRQG